jgi:hypothetical protein
MFHHCGSVKISGDETEGVSVTRKRSGVENCLCRLLCAGFLALALVALAAPAGAVDGQDCTEVAPGGAVEAYDRTAEEPCPCLGHYGRAAEKPCIWDEYDAKEAGHPLRIAAYVLHPVGVIIDWVIFRPAWWIGSHDPFYTLFGRTD